MHLKYLSDEALLKNTRDLAAREREVTLQVLHHLREVERRYLFAALTYSSLFEYCVKELGYSNGSAQRRIASMRLFKELPEIEERISDGSLNLSLVSRAQTFFNQEKIKSVEIKKEVLGVLVGKSDLEAERTLASRATTPAAVSPERKRAVTGETSEVRFAAENGFLDEIDELRGLLAHAHPGMSMAEALKYGVRLALEKHRPKRLMERPAATSLPVPEGTVRRAPTSAIKRAVWARDGGRCTFEGDGRRCSSRSRLEFDHIQPWALGGPTTVENLRLRCRTHNRLGAIRTFGNAKISRFVGINPG